MKNIYHLLDSNAGYGIKQCLLSAKKEYEDEEKLYWVWEFCAKELLKTLFHSEFLSVDDFILLYEDLNYLIRLYKGAKGKALGSRKVWDI